MIHVLSIAGSDSSGGAGIQGDIKTITAHGAHALSAITAITAQNTTEITSVFHVPNLKEQLDTIACDIHIDSIKIGMLGSHENVGVVIRFLQDRALAQKIPVVLDPVIFSTTGQRLLEEKAIDLMTRELLSCINLITPNLVEAEFLAGMSIRDIKTGQDACFKIFQRFGCQVLLKGGHLDMDSGQAIDIYYDGTAFRTYTSTRLKAKHTHGTGCCLSSAIACQLGYQRPMKDAISLGKTFVTLAIKYGYPIGKGEGPVNPLIHFITNFVTMNDVASTCLASGGRPMMAEALEEMEEVVPKSKGLVINLGTMNASRREVMFAALMAVDTSQQKVLLDPVGCGSSTYRLDSALAILKTGKINILKVNTTEGLALLGEAKTRDCGVDSHDFDEESKVQLAKALACEFHKSNEGIVVVVTGEVDVVATVNNCESFEGGTYMQQKITGTGCMLNAVIMTYVAEVSDIYKGTIKAIKHMNLASERATTRLQDKAYLMIYKDLLIDEISAAKKRLYLITDEKLDFEKELLVKTEAALKAGVDILQYRVKFKSEEDRLREALILRKMTHKYGTTFIINDDVELAKQVKADGVHLGFQDKSIADARECLGESYIIGATAKTLEQASLAWQQGANYLGVGALNPSPTKPEAIPVTLTLLKEITDNIHIPVYGIGGIRSHNLTIEQMDVLNGVAVVSAVYTGGIAEMNAIRDMLRRN